LQQVPLKHNHKVIFMTRPIEEVVASQKKNDRARHKGADLNPDQLSAASLPIETKFCIGSGAPHGISRDRLSNPCAIPRHLSAIIKFRRRPASFARKKWLPSILRYRKRHS
jgi:hypothetical protein